MQRSLRDGQSIRRIGPRQRLVRQLGMRPAEIRRRRILADLDDAAADGARAGEMLEQRLAVAAADRARQRRQVLVEAAEHFQHRVLVGEEHVAPHGRIGGGDAGEIAKAAGGEFQHLRPRHLAQLVGGADDGVGDQMRQVAGDRRARGRGARPSWSRHWRRALARTRRASRPRPGRRPPAASGCTSD